MMDAATGWRKMEPRGRRRVVSLSISAATNRITTPGFAYDAAGNLVQWPGGTVTLGAEYDVDGRLSVVRWDGVERERYFYNARNLRVKRGFYYQVYGLSGELLGEYQASAGSVVPQMWRERVYFAGRLMATMEQDGTTAEANTDRLGSIRAARRYPFGEGNTVDNDEFATYRKDTSTQHDYAWHRYYSATWGRFSSPDPYVMSGGLTNPQGWNRYSYVSYDPVNWYDPPGLAWSYPCYREGVYTTCYSFGENIVDYFLDNLIMGWDGPPSPGQDTRPEGIRLAATHLGTIAGGGFKKKEPCLKFLGKLIEGAGLSLTVDELAGAIMKTASEAIWHVYDGPSSNTALTEEKFPGTASPEVTTVGEWFAVNPGRVALSQYNGSAIWIREKEWASAWLGILPSSHSGQYGLGTLMHEILHKQTVGGGFDHRVIGLALEGIGLKADDYALGRNRLSDQIGKVCF